MENFSEPMGLLIDNTKCIGCRACQTACKQWNNLPAEKTTFFGGEGYQNPKDLSGSTYTLIKFHEVIELGFLEKTMQTLYRPRMCSCLSGARCSRKETVWTNCMG